MRQFHSIEQVDTGILYLLELASQVHAVWIPLSALALYSCYRQQY
jgi:hypothetical protein